MSEVPGGVYQAFDAIKTAGGVFDNAPKNEGTRTDEMRQTNADRNPELAAAVDAEGRQTGGPEHLQGGESRQLTAAERNPGTTAEQSLENAAKKQAEVAALDEAIMGLDPMPSAPSARAETRAETATA
jgi:hypothetical protein